MEPLAYSTEGLAKALDVPQSTIRRWRERHCGPPAHKIGRQIRYLVSDVEDWLRSQPTKGRAPAVTVLERVKAQQLAGPPTFVCSRCSTTTTAQDETGLRSQGWTGAGANLVCTACSYTG